MNRILTSAVDTTNLPPKRTTAKSPCAAPYGLLGADFDFLLARLLVLALRIPPVQELGVARFVGFSSQVREASAQI